MEYGIVSGVTSRNICYKKIGAGSIVLFPKPKVAVKT
jgi:hypothetical protein